MTPLCFTLFHTAIGRCGATWSAAGLCATPQDGLFEARTLKAHP